MSASDYASPEQLLQGKVDFPSEIYSLGATMCFLLTGVFYSAYPRSAQTKRFARPLRSLISRTLEDDPSLRPQDPVLFTEQIRDCLAAVEWRQALQNRFGIPFAAVVAKPRLPRFARRPRTRPTSLIAEIGSTPVAPPPVTRPSRLRPVWAIVGCLLAGGLIGALLLPEDVVMRALHRHKSNDAIGVTVGVPVPESSAAAIARSNANVSIPTPAQAITAPSPVTVASQLASPAGRQVVQAPNATAAPVAQQFPPANAPVVAAQQSPPSPVIPAPDSASASPAQTPEQAAPVAVASHSASPSAVSADISSRAETGAAPASTPAVVASSNAAPEPAPPAEAPSDDGRASASHSTASSNPDDTDAAQNNPDVTAAEPAPAPKSSPTDSANVKSRSKKSSAVTQNRSRFNKRHVPRALPAEPDTPPDGNGTMRARVVGVTPAGNVVLELPSGERVIVSPQDAERYSHGSRPHRRTRRVIIERRPVFVPPQYGPYQAPYQPFVPPDA